MELRVFIRGHVGRGYPDNYLQSWKDLSRKQAYRALKERQPRKVPAMDFSRSSGLCVMSLRGYDWLYFVEREYLPTVSPLFYYVWGDEDPFSKCLFPFYLAALRLQYEAGGQFPRQHYMEVLQTELLVRRPHHILNELFDAGLLWSLGRYLRPADLSHLESKSGRILEEILSSWRGDRPSGDERPRNHRPTGRSNDLAAVGMDREHASQLSNLVGASISIRRMAEERLRTFSGADRIAFERDLMPQVHAMVNHFLYAEARELLAYCQGALLEGPLTEQQSAACMGRFESRAEMFMGGLVVEICGMYDVQCYAAVLPSVIELIEAGRLYPRRNKGLYQLFGRIQLRQKVNDVR